ncbi:hypothetical protein A3C87_01095 [Candidatus Kaiserbacteria bacterium RIFCSPHIGHO2_02_FULL_49_34]|uniref:HEPN domain-containing protein n=1 Tax=Candidatus Kaiserbacteria bacterium RIFCSPHIGHO2_02_FULL_49_34 TaxID=1798491 RepID=A0A1F6DJW4_9BACT|nr:MAG: hypothetical protein A3C87_01095 [Candidatus Kaiserbacteria bacterium RIFCSPHIGHO2_02_FULL_49_34]
MAIKKENNKQRKYDWVVFAQSYFLISRLACQELLSDSEKKYSKSNERDNPYQPEDLYVSILFNIKHGIEVFTKALSIFAYGEYEEGHDIKILFDNAKQKISIIKLQPRQKGFYNDISQADIDASLKDLEEIKKLVLYFFELDFLKQKLNSNFVINDHLNDVFRYPDSKASIRIDWGTLLISRVHSPDIKETLEKLDGLNELFNKTGYLHSILSG